MITLEELGTIDDPLALFKASTEAMLQHQKAVDTLATIRTRAVGALHAAGVTNREIASEVSISPPRVAQLVTANDAPVIAVFRAWASLEPLLDVVAQYGISKGPGGVAGAVEVLREVSKLEPTVLDDLVSLRKFRNGLLHGQFQIDVGQATNFVNVCEGVATRLVVWLSKRGVTVGRDLGPAALSGILPQQRLMNASMDVATRMEIERRHDDLAPMVEIEYVERESRGKHGSLWALLRNKSNRGYDLAVEIVWGTGGTASLSNTHVDPLGTTRMFVADSARNAPSQLVLRYKADDWDYPCPCPRPDEFGHWTQRRTIVVDQ